MTTDLTDLIALDHAAQDLLFRDARTANTFTDEPVSDEQLEAIYDLIKWAPTSMNIQPLRVVFIRSDEARQRLLPHMSDGNRAKTATAPVVAILAADVDFHEELPRTFPHLPNAKAMFDGERDGRRATAELNAGLQIGYFILGVRAAGLAAGPMTGLDADAITEEFFGDGAHQVKVVVNIGHPGEAAWMDRLPRLDFEDVAQIL